MVRGTRLVARLLPTLVALATLSGSGCLVPYLSPPLRGSVTGGTSRTELADGSFLSRPTLSVEGAVHVLQAIPALRERWLDIGPGYFGTFRFHEALRDPHHGLFLDVVGYPWSMPLGAGERSGRMRLTTRVAPEYVFAREARGYGVTGGVGLEWVWPVDGLYDGHGPRGFAVGYAVGEGGIGLELRGAHRVIGDETAWFLGGSLVFRTPASFGLALSLPD